MGNGGLLTDAAVRSHESVDGIGRGCYSSRWGKIVWRACIGQADRLKTCCHMPRSASEPETSANVEEDLAFGRAARRHTLTCLLASAGRPKKSPVVWAACAPSACAEGLMFVPQLSTLLVGSRGWGDWE